MAPTARLARSLTALVALATLFNAGCHEKALRPVRVGVTKFDLVGPQLLPRWSMLALDLGTRLGQPVQFETLTPHQIAVHLGTGRIALAMVDAVEYAEIAPAENDIVIAGTVSQRNATERVGLVITKADSPIESLAGLKGKRFDFLPHDDTLNAAAYGCLHRVGVTKDDLARDRILGEIHHLNSFEVAKAVAYENVAAGIVDEAEFKTWPKRGGTFLLQLVSQDQFRVLQRTPAVPGTVVLASKRADPELVETAKAYFLNEVNRKQLTVLNWMGVRGFAPVRREAYTEFHQSLKGVSLPGPDPILPLFRDLAATQPSPKK